MDTIDTVGFAIVLFASTNVDDLFVLLGFFPEGRIPPYGVAIGQYLGIAALVLASLAASPVSLMLRPEHVGLLGLMPVAIGLKKLRELRRGEDGEGGPQAGLGSVLTVAGVTVANGGDNIGIYTPVLATSGAGAILTVCFVFAAMVALWLLFAHRLLDHPAIGAPIRRYGPRVTPFVLILLGLLILYEAGSFGLLA